MPGNEADVQLLSEGTGPKVATYEVVRKDEDGTTDETVEFQAVVAATRDGVRIPDPMLWQQELLEEIRHLREAILLLAEELT